MQVNFSQPFFSTTTSNSSNHDFELSHSWELVALSMLILIGNPALHLSTPISFMLNDLETSLAFLPPKYCTMIIPTGSVDKQAVEVTNCFCVPHKEYEDHVEAELQYAQDMFELNKKVGFPFY